MTILFEKLTSSFSKTFNKIKFKNKISKKEMDEVLTDIKVALLEADVNYYVVKTFIKNITDKVEDMNLLENFSPQEQIIKITYDEIKDLLGKETSFLKEAPKNNRRIIMIVGLQGSGKTTFSAKLAKYLKAKKNKKPLLVSADVYRPAARDQLKILGETISVPVFSLESDSPTEIVLKALNNNDYMDFSDIIIDTAGRLHVDDELMDELNTLKNISNPTEILLVVDSMTGQDAINTSIEFNDRINISGVILSKMDGDTRGGVALTVKSMLEVPIKFISYSEKLDGIETFYPDRLANRILGKGDILHIVDKFKDNFDENDIENLASKIFSKNFDLNDFLQQIKQIQKLGPLGNLMKLMPGMNDNILKKIDDKKTEEEIKLTEVMINSMTIKERKNPKILNSSRKQRISKGSGVKIQNINSVIKKFEQAKKMAGSISNILPDINNQMHLKNFDMSKVMDMFSSTHSKRKIKKRGRNKFPF